MSTEERTPLLGDKVEFTHYLIRKHIADKPDHYYSEFTKTWVPYPVCQLVGLVAEPGEPERLAGILVGVRQLKDGRATGGYDDEGRGFAPTKYYPGYLVAFDVRRRPVLVLPEHITFLEDK